MKRFHTPRFRFIQKHWQIISLLAVLLLGAFLRLYHLISLPPALHPDEASVGLRALQITRLSGWRSLCLTCDPVWIMLQTLPIKLFGPTILALRLLPALMGTLSLYLIYVLGREWFGQRVGLGAAFLLATSPWAFSMSRDGTSASAIILIVTLSLWLITIAWEQEKLWLFGLVGVALVAGLFASPLGGWWLVELISAGLILLILNPRHFKAWVKPTTIMGAITVIGIVGYFLQQHFQLPHLSSQNLVSTGKALGMLIVHGDDNYRFNLGGQPMLNAFVGIMFIAGLLVNFTKLNRPKHAALVILFFLGLLPVIVRPEDAPSAIQGALMLPLAMLLAAEGIGYMLDRWYATFPINAAARTTALFAISLPLSLSVLFGYNQYFVAWAATPQSHAAYSESSTAMANYLRQNNPTEETYIAGEIGSAAVIQYLDHKQAPGYKFVTGIEINSIELNGKPKRILFSMANKDEALTSIKKHFGSGKIMPSFDATGSRELFYVFTVTK